MTHLATPEHDKHQRLPVEILSHGMWLHDRFCLRYRDMAELLFGRGILVTSEAPRQWCRKCGQQYVHQLCRRRPRPGDQWYLDEGFFTVNGKRHALWRAVNEDDTVRDILVQSRHNKQAATKFCCTVRRGLPYGPRVVITDQLTSYGTAKRERLPGVEHRQSRSLNNRCAPAHRPTHQREHRMQGCPSPGPAQRFRAAYGPIAHHSRPRRHLLSASESRPAMRDRGQSGAEMTGTERATSETGRTEVASLFVW